MDFFTTSNDLKVNLWLKYQYSVGKPVEVNKRDVLPDPLHHLGRIICILAESHPKILPLTTSIKRIKDQMKGEGGGLKGTSDIPPGDQKCSYDYESLWSQEVRLQLTYNHRPKLFWSKILNETKNIYTEQISGYTHGCHRLGKCQKRISYFQVREKSGNFTLSRGKIHLQKKSGKFKFQVILCWPSKPCSQCR